jgi:hypothetical protein
MGSFDIAKGLSKVFLLFFKSGENIKNYEQ